MLFFQKGHIKLIKSTVKTFTW